MAESSPKLKRKRNADTDVDVVLGSQDPGTLHPVLGAFVNSLEVSPVEGS